MSSLLLSDKRNLTLDHWINPKRFSDMTFVHAYTPGYQYWALKQDYGPLQQK